MNYGRSDTDRIWTEPIKVSLETLPTLSSSAEELQWLHAGSQCLREGAVGPLHGRSRGLGHGERPRRTPSYLHTRGWHKQDINDQQGKERINLFVFLIPLSLTPPPKKRWTGRECLIRKIKLLRLALLMLRQTARLISPPALSDLWGKIGAGRQGRHPPPLSPPSLWCFAQPWVAAGWAEHSVTVRAFSRSHSQSGPFQSDHSDMTGAQNSPSQAAERKEPRFSSLKP